MHRSDDISGEWSGDLSLGVEVVGSEPSRIGLRWSFGRGDDYGQLCGHGDFGPDRHVAATEHRAELAGRDAL